MHFLFPSQGDADRFDMEVESGTQKLQNFLFGLNKEESTVLAQLLQTMANAGEQAPMMASYYHGILRGRLYGEHNICLSHGVNHDEVIPLPDPQGSTLSRDSKSDASDHIVVVEENVQAQPIIQAADEDAPRPLTTPEIEYAQGQYEELVADLEKYNVGFLALLDVPHERWFDPMFTPRASYQVTCKNCAYLYPSLDDRMMKRPDECPGCFDKAAHG